MEPLLKAATAHSHLVSYNAVWALAHLGDHRAFDALAQAVRRNDPAIRRVALKGLIHLNDIRALDIFLYFLRSDRYVLRKIVLQGIAHLGSAAVPTLLNILSSKDNPERLRRGIIRVLGSIGDSQAVPDLLTYLHSDPASQVRAEAAHALGRIGNPTAAEALLNELNSPAPNIRASAVTALGDLKYISAQESLKHLSNDTNLNVRRAVACALHKISD